MEARANPFLRDIQVRSISISSFPFHICRVKQQEIGQEKKVIQTLKNCWRIMKRHVSQ